MFNSNKKLALKLFDSQGFINESDISEQGGLMKFLNGGRRINKLFGSPSSSFPSDDNDNDSSNDIILVQKVDDEEEPGTSQGQNEESRVGEKSLENKSAKENSLILPETQESPQRTPIKKFRDSERKINIMRSLGLKQLDPIVIDDLQECAKEQVASMTKSSPELQNSQRKNEKSPVRTNLSNSGGNDFKVPLTRSSTRRFQHDIRKSLFKDLRSQDTGFACSTPRTNDKNFKDFRMNFSPINLGSINKNKATSAKNEVVPTQDPKTPPSKGVNNKMQSPKQLRSLMDIEKDIEKCYENLAGKKTPNKRTPVKKPAVAEPLYNITTEDDMSMEIEPNPKSPKKTTSPKKQAPINKSSYIPVNIVETPVISRTKPTEENTFTELKEKLKNVSEFESDDEIEDIEIPEIPKTPKKNVMPKSHATMPTSPRMITRKMEIDEKKNTPKKSAVQNISNDDSDSEEEIKNNKKINNTPKKSANVSNVIQESDSEDSESKTTNVKKKPRQIIDTDSESNEDEIQKMPRKSPVKNRPNADRDSNKKKDSQMKSKLKNSQISDGDSDTDEEVPKKKTQKSTKKVEKKSQKKSPTKNNQKTDSDSVGIKKENDTFDKLKEMPGPSKSPTKTRSEPATIDDDVFKKPAPPKVTRSSTQIESKFVSPEGKSKMKNVSFGSSMDNSNVPSPVIRSLRNSIRSSSKLSIANTTNDSFAIPKNSLSKRKRSKIDNKVQLDYLELSKRIDKKSNTKNQADESLPNMSKKRFLYHQDNEDSDYETGESMHKKTTEPENNVAEEPKEKPDSSKSTKRNKKVTEQDDPIVPNITAKKSTQQSKSKKKSPLKNTTNTGKSKMSSELDFLKKYGPMIDTNNENMDSTNISEGGRIKRPRQLRKPYWMAPGMQEYCLLYSDYRQPKTLDGRKLTKKKLKDALNLIASQKIITESRCIEESEPEVNVEMENLNPPVNKKTKRTTEVNIEEAEPQKKKKKKSKSTNNEIPVESISIEMSENRPTTMADNILEIIEQMVTTGLCKKSTYSNSFLKENCRSCHFNYISMDVVDEGIKCLKYKNVDNSGYLVFEQQAMKNMKKCKKYPLNLLVMSGEVGITINDDYGEYGPGSIISLENCRYSIKNTSVMERAIIFYMKGTAPSLPNGSKN